MKLTIPSFIYANTCIKLTILLKKSENEFLLFISTPLPIPVIILFARWLHLQFLKTKDNENHILFLCFISHVTEQIESKFAFSYQRIKMMNKLMWRTGCMFVTTLGFPCSLTFYHPQSNECYVHFADCFFVWIFLFISNTNELNSITMQEAQGQWWVNLNKHSGTS